jgi:hypothetical protein
MDEAELARRQREDFDLLVLCQAKGNPAMYELLRDRSLARRREETGAAGRRHREDGVT